MPTARAARTALRDALLSAGWDQDATDDACLAVSELVTNALLHAGGVEAMRIRIDRHRLRVEVDDRSTALPTRQPAAPDATSGRGMLIVDAITDAWGTERLTNGRARKQVWFEMGAHPWATT